MYYLRMLPCLKLSRFTFGFELFISLDVELIMLYFYPYLHSQHFILALLILIFTYSTLHVHAFYYVNVLLIVSP
jgi:hypothetical protein